MQKTTKTVENNIDAVVLALVRGDNTGIKASLTRLYLSGDLDAADLALCVERGLLELPDYNDIIGA